jgi:hypothetical protein
LQGDDEEATDETEDEDVALHDGVVKRSISLPAPGFDCAQGFADKYSMKGA